MFCIYFAKSQKNNKIYVGFTKKAPEERVKDHNLGSNAWSKQNGPFKLIYYEDYFCKEDAKAREKFYKSGFGRKIKNLIVENMDG